MTRTALRRACGACRRGAAGIALIIVASARALAQSAPAASPLERPLALTAFDASLAEVLRSIAAGSGVRLSYSTDLLPPSVRVTVALPTTTVGAALDEVLRGTGLGLIVVGAGHVVILRAPHVRQSDRAAAPAPEVGRGLTTHALDRVIVMGTPAAGAPERENPVSVTVVDQAEMREDGPTRMADLFRASVPGVVAWDLGVAGPVAQVGSVRGSSSFSANYLKGYLDGVELASPYLLFAIDPDVVARLEVIRGPQGSAMYGSDAISGVAHVVTAKGDLGRRRRAVNGSVSVGAMESEYTSAPALAGRQLVAATGSGTRASWALAGTFARGGGVVDGARNGSANLVATGRALAGSVLLEGTARATRLDFSAPVNPDLADALGPRSAPRIAGARAAQVTDVRTVGLTAMHEPVPHWRQTLVVGYDGNTGALIPQRNPASVADALLGASEEDAARASVRYSSSLRLDPGPRVATTITVGAEWSRLERERAGSSDVIAVGSGPFAPVRRVALYVDTVANTGAFAQWKLDVGGVVFAHAGIRGERNSSFGDGYGTAWSPAVGAAVVREAGGFTVKLRGAFGRGIRPPPPSARRALATREFRQLANPDLAPEEQEGIEGGVELHRRGRFVVTATAFDQLARGLVQHVLPDPRQQPRAIQQQNVGRITNRGVELSASGVGGSLEGDATFSTVVSRVAALSPSYTGDLRVGDAVPEVPEWTASVSVRFRARGTVAVAGVTAIGPWSGYDWLAYYTASATGTAAPSLRSYAIRYPSSVRPRAGITHDGTGRWGWFVRVENLTNEQHDSRDNLQVTAGRTIWTGLRFASR